MLWHLLSFSQSAKSMCTGVRIDVPLCYQVLKKSLLTFCGVSPETAEKAETMKYMQMRRICWTDLGGFISLHVFFVPIVRDGEDMQRTFL